MFTLRGGGGVKANLENFYIFFYGFPTVYKWTTVLQVNINGVTVMLCRWVCHAIVTLDRRFLVSLSYIGAKWHNLWKNRGVAR